MQSLWSQSTPKVKINSEVKVSTFKEIRGGENFRVQLANHTKQKVEGRYRFRSIKAYFLAQI